LIGISMADSSSKVRRMEFDIKADNPPAPVYFTIDSSEGWAKLTLVDYSDESSAPRKQASAASYMQ